MVVIKLQILTLLGLSMQCNKDSLLLAVKLFSIPGHQVVLAVFGIFPKKSQMRLAIVVIKMMKELLK